MPIFESNGKKYNVQDEHIEKFGAKFPDATTVMERDGKKYRVKANDYNTFLGDTLLTAQPQGQSGGNGYTFTAEGLERMDKFDKPRYKEVKTEGQYKMPSIPYTEVELPSENRLGEIGLPTDVQNMRRVADRVSAKKQELRAKGADITVGDVQDYEDLKAQELKAVEDYELAARETERYKDMSFGDKLIYRNARKDEYNALGTMLQAGKELVAGTVEPVYDLLEHVGDWTNWGGLEELGKEGNKNVEEYYANGNKKMKGLVGEAASMVPQTLGMVVGALTRNPNLMKLSTRVQIGSSMGQAAYEAEKAGASGGQIFATALANGLVELGTEMIPLQHWLKKVSPTFGKKVVSEVTEKALSREADMLLDEARKTLGNRITAKSAGEFAQGLLAEGGSEYAAEFLQTFVPLIYESPEKYPTLLDALKDGHKNGMQGFRGGLMMASVINPAASYSQRRAHDMRRKQQGYVDIAAIDDNGKTSIVEILGVDQKGQLIGIKNGETLIVDESSIKERNKYDYNFFKHGETEFYKEIGYEQEPTGENAVKEANEYTNARNEVVKVLGFAEDADVDAMLEGRTAEEIAMGDIEVEDAVNNYIQARARRDGFRERYQEERDRQFAESDRSVDETANNGMVYTTTAPGGEKIIITGGKVVLDNEGYIDVNQSEGLVAMFPDGSRKPVRPGDLREKIEVSNAEETKAARRASIEERWRAEFESAENAYVEQQKRAEGVVFDVTDKEGTHRVEVVKEGDEMSNILVDGEQKQISTEMLNALRGEAGVAQTENGKVEGENEVAPVVETPAQTELPKEKQTPAPIPVEKRGKEERAAYHLVPIERTMEDLHDGTLEPDEIVGLIDARIKEAESDVKAVEKKKPVIGADKNAYVAAKQQWQADMEAAKAKLDYYNQLKAINAEAIRSEMREAVEAVEPQVLIEQTPDEFVANQLGGFIKITPESFQKETGLKAEQKQMVGVIAGKDKGGVTIEQAAETILENYGDELRGLGFNGDMQDMRDMIINILSNGNPRSYAKKGAEMRAQESVEQQMSQLESIAIGMGFKDTDEMIAYEEAVVPRIIQDYTGFDETEYFNNLAENIKYDTTRESEGTRRGSKLLQGEQSADNAGTGNIAEPGQRGEIQGDVYSGGENAAPQGNQQVSGSEIPNNQIPGLKGYTTDEVVNLTKEHIADILGGDIRIVDMRVIGSRSNGTNSENSDLDVLVEFDGDISEDAFFNAVNGEDALYIDGVRVDINPITKDKSGTIEQWVNRNAGYSKAEGGNASGQSGVAVPVAENVVTEPIIEAENVNAHNVIKSEDEKKALRERAAKWAKKLGVKVNVLETYDEVADEMARKQILESRTPGWFSGGEVYIYMPHIANESDLDKTVIHEAVAHKGIKQMLGEEFNKFLDNVWEMMSDEAKAEFLSYVGAGKNATQADRRAAADEYVASIAEKVYKKQGLTAEEKNVWQKFVERVKNFFAGKFNVDEAKAEVMSKDVLDEKDIAKMVLASYETLQSNKVDNEVASVDGETMFSKKNSERRQEKNRINNTIDSAVGIIMGSKEVAKRYRLKKEAERKQLAKEIYSSVLKGDFNDVTLEQINKYIEDATPANPFGRRISQRLPQRMERALRQGARANAVDALFSRISESAVPANGRFSEAGRREIEERKKELLKGWAIATGNWHTDLKEFTDDTEPISEGKDSKVYSSKDGRFVIKASKGKPYGKRFRPDIDNIALFNDVFRNSRYEILGYGEIDGEFVRILQQPIVDFTNSVPLTSEERREYMQSLGFEPLNEANTAFADGEIVIADLQKGNIVKDAAGNISVIDADAKLHTKDVGGDYTYPPVETDLPEGTVLEISAEEGNGTKFRKATPEMNAEYMGAVENGDIETAERLVKEAAKLAMPDTKVVDEDGYPKVVYHGSRSVERFNEFDATKGLGLSLGSTTENSNRFTFFASTENAAKAYKDGGPTGEDYIGEGNLYEVFLDLKNPRVVDFDGLNWTGDGVEVEYFDALFGEWMPLKNGELDYFKNEINALEEYRRIFGAGKIDESNWRVKLVKLSPTTNEVAEEALAAGHDGVIIKNVYDSGFHDGPITDYISFSPNQIKSADAVTYDDNGNVIPLGERFNGGKNDIRFRKVNKNQEIFVSNARKAVEEIKQEKATPQQWLAMIKKNGGLKAGEEAWLGLEEWLNEKQGAVTKQEILDFIGENKIQIEEVEYGMPESSQKFKELQDEYRELYYEYDRNVERAYDEMVERYGDDFSLAFDGVGDGLEIATFGEDAAEAFLNSNSINSTRLDYTTDGLENKREIALTVPTIEPYNASDEVHFGDAGNGRAVAWVRFGETTDSEGNRVLVIDEIQSKRHQDGREKGYKSSEAQKLQQERDALYDKMYTIGLSVEEHNRFKELGELLADVSSDGVPAAPFEKNWQELAMKRMLRLAAEEGFDKVAWTTGEQQAERYNISKQVERIDVEDNGVEEFSDGTPVAKNVALRTANDNVVHLYVDADGVAHGREFDGKSLAEIVGKELAEKIMQPGDFTIESDGLRIGGEGMKGFYDKMLPSFVSKYTKKWGAKVGTVEMPNLEQNNVMHSVDVTPQMRESVMEGQTMFRFIGKKGAANLDKAEEATTRLDNLNVAREMETGGKDAKAIKLATGWERGADGKWRYETDDVKVNRGAELFSLETYKSYPIAGSIEIGRVDENSTIRLTDLVKDDELFKAYPEMEEFFVSFEKVDARYGGLCDFANKMIIINKDYIHSLESILVHEIQHAIQYIEGFATGSNPEQFRHVEFYEVSSESIHDMYNIRKAADELIKDGKYKYLRSAIKNVFEEYRQRGWLSPKTIEAFELNVEGEDWGVDSFVSTTMSYSADELNDYSINEDWRNNDMYMRTAGEVESRNVQERLGMSPEERRNKLAEETEDVSRKDQIFIFDNLGVSGMMGSRVDARMAEVASHFDGKELSAEQRSVVDVFGGKADNLTISVKTKDGNERKVVMRQGNETGAGAKHSLYRHYGTGVGVITSNDIISIPDVVANGVRTEKQRGNTRLAEYKLTDANGNEFTVLTEIKKGKENFNDFYSNKKAPLSGTFNTQSAHTANNNALSADKGSDNSLNVQENGTMFHAEQDVPVGEVESKPLTFAEKITNSVLEASAKNKENLALRSDALRMFGRDVANVLKLMGKQREYDKSTVDQLVKLAKMYFKDAQLLGGLTPYQVGRVMTRLNSAVGKRDITDDANELVNILVDAHNKELDRMLDKAAKTKAKKVNASGVEVIGKLDKEGQLLLEEYNNSKVLDLETIDEKILDLQNEAAEASGKLEGENGEVERETAAKIRGLELARQYREEILAKQTEIKGLEQELKTAKQDAKDGAMDRAAYKEFRRATERAILESKLEMVDAYHGLIHGLGGDISSSAKRAKLFQQQQIDHVKEIQHNANSDLLGHPAEAQGETPDKWNSAVPRLFMSAMPTFQTMLKFFGEKAADGRGYLYERFIPQHTQASHNEYVGKTEAREKMRDKLTEIFGKKTTIENFMDMSRKEGAVLEYQEGGQKKTIDLTRGQVLYLYMINKMADGQMKLSRMGITDADVQKMAKELPVEFVRFADWVQEDFLTELRDKYNAVHERMFGAPMAAIESYFPIKINKRSRGEKVEPGMNVEDKPSTVTGSVIKRTKNAIAIDLSADAMQVLLGHIDDMENWAAWAEFRRDLKSLLNYRHFQNQVKGMESLRYGSGEKLWKNFVDVANIAAGSFKPSSTAADRAVRNIAKGVVSSKIAFRYFTAVKQILSTPAFWSEVDFGKMMNAYLHQKEAWDWAIKNLPGFSKRWEGRASGNEILLESDADWKVWQNRAVQWLSKKGMRANAFIDALTVATGAKAVFETKYEMFKKAGYSEERAREKALNRAAEAYNESQQSSESAYLSPLQAEATFVSSVLTAYRNSPFGYNRKMATAIANLKKKMKKGFKQESIEYMIKQLMRDGLNEEQAKKFAKSTYRRSVARDAADVALYEFFLNYVWVLGPSLIYILGGDDDEKKKELNVEALIDGAMGGLGNLPAGETLTGAIKAIAEGDVSNFKLPQAVAMQDMETIADLMQTDPVRAAGEVLNTLVAMGVGVNPQTFTDMFVALADTEDWSDPREIAMLVLRLINAPNSKLELLEADEAMENYGANIEEITREYAEYQKSKRAPLTGWLYSDESEQKAIERYEKRFKKILDERFEVVVENTDEYDMWYENSDPQMKAKLAKLRQKFLEGDKETTMEKLDSIDVTKKVLFGSGYDEVNTVYYELSTAEDEDMAMMIDEKLKELKPMMNEYNKLRGDEHKAYRKENLEQIRLYNKLNGCKNDVNTLKGVMKKKPEKAQEKMDVIRKLRTKAVELINNYNE